MEELGTVSDKKSLCSITVASVVAIIDCERNIHYCNKTLLQATLCCAPPSISCVNTYENTCKIK